MYGTEGCSEFMADKLPYSAIIGKHVRKGISSGVSVKDIMASIQKYSHAPSSTSTFYKLYGGVREVGLLLTLLRNGKLVVKKRKTAPL